MGPRVPPNLIRVFWGYISPANGPLGSTKPNRGVLGLQTHHQWAFGFCRTHSGCFGVTNPPPMGLRVPPNTRGVFWGYKSTANGPSGSAENNRGVLGLQILRQWAIRTRRTQLGCFGVTNPPPMALRFRQTQSGCFP
ncbi:Hypothetical protein FKW44_000483 [Caligus rogercresseyi]|uniref:Uncharacterized protein n=1 Tax=Caligus rogercresseyi TaxID=217165 RepID=A0A7T8QUY1_CALRO|nr:Hypothetical protein FKW44_000483 [Caligus rogercresseyi]